MRTEIAESVIADAKRILLDHAAGVVVPPESLDWAVFIALANLGGHTTAREASPLEKLRAAAIKARDALSELLMTRDPKVYSGALRALDEALGDLSHARVSQEA